MKKGFKDNIEKVTRENSNFRRVLYTGECSQLVLMSLLPKEEIGLETHKDNDQFFRFEAGQGQVIVNEAVYDVSDGDAVIVPRGAQHNVTNTSDNESLKFYTIYSPAHHKDGIIHQTKLDSEKNDMDFDSVTTE
jgi:mannose-6-phosphate isomerase-like protein (cupin superfamily)